MSPESSARGWRSRPEGDEPGPSFFNHGWRSQPKADEPGPSFFDHGWRSQSKTDEPVPSFSGSSPAGASRTPDSGSGATGSAGRQRPRQHFQQQLRELEQRALGGLDIIVEQLDRVLEALEHQDVELAQMVIADDDRVDGRYLEIHQGILSLLALQSPVAGDLRVVAALLHVMKNIERMGDQCVNIAKLIPLSGHEPPVRRELLEALLKMGALARSEVTQSKAAFAARDVALAEDLVRQDRAINRLNRDIFRMALEIGDDPDTREWAMHMILVARALERVGDNAVDIGEQVAFVVTGLFREFSDSSHPFGRD